MPIIKLTERVSNYGESNFTTNPILIATEQVIDIKRKHVKSGNVEYDVTNVASVGAMVTNNSVIETIEEIEELIRQASK